MWTFLVKSSRVTYLHVRVTLFHVTVSAYNCLYPLQYFNEIPEAFIYTPSWISCFDPYAHQVCGPGLRVWLCTRKGILLYKSKLSCFQYKLSVIYLILPRRESSCIIIPCPILTYSCPFSHQSRGCWWLQTPPRQLKDMNLNSQL